MTMAERVHAGGHDSGPRGSSAPDCDRPIDLVHLARATLGDRALEREVLGLFVRQATLQVDRLKAAGDPAAFRAAAHTLKGAALGVGAHDVARLAGEVDVHAEERHGPEATAAMARLSARIVEAQLYIRGLIEGGL